MFKGKNTSELVALTMALGISVALNLMTIAVLWVSVVKDIPLGENATQVLTGWGGGFLGVLGAFVGYQFGKNVDDPLKQPPKPPKPPDPPGGRHNPQQGPGGQPPPA